MEDNYSNKNHRILQGSFSAGDCAQPHRLVVTGTSRKHAIWTCFSRWILKSQIIPENLETVDKQGPVFNRLSFELVNKLAGSARILIFGARLVTALAIMGGTAEAEVRTVHLWANQPNADVYAPHASFAQVPDGTQITRSGPGRYDVDLRGFLPGSLIYGVPPSRGGLGHVQVSAYGATGHFCQVVNLSVTVAVACFDASGHPADTLFSLLAVIAGPADNVAYAWSNLGDMARYTPEAAYALRPGGEIVIERSGPGEYTVAMGAEIHRDANVQITAYGEMPRRCQIGAWISGLVSVHCTDVAGRPADAAFTVLALRPDTDERRYSFAWANDPETNTYVPDIGFAFAPEAAGGPQVTRYDHGRYSVRLGARLQQVQVTAYGSRGEYCTPMGWSTSTVSVACFEPGGAPVDSRFTVLAFNTVTGVEPPLFGFADLHTHPASFLGFGGKLDGHQGMMWGRPAVGAGYSDKTASERFEACCPETHAESSSGLAQTMLREVIISTSDDRTGHHHTTEGPPGFEVWPNSLVLSHQQMDVDWLRRAHQGGLRAFVASAVDNEIVDTVYDWSYGNISRLVNTFFKGRSIRGDLGMPQVGFAFDSARDQLNFIKMMAEENDFMEIAFDSERARDIIANGRMAIILGLELDNLTPTEIRTLVDEDGVRLVTPIHFVDNEIGGAAAYELMFSVLNGIIGVDGQPYDLVPEPNLDFFIGNEFGVAQDQINTLTLSALGWRSIGMDCAPTGNEDGSSPRRCDGQRNSKGLNSAGEDLIKWLIHRGVMVDMAHMSQISQEETVNIAEASNCPVINSHTGVRRDRFEYGATERSIPESLVVRMLNLGGIIGLGTGIGEVADPRRIYYNSGNPLIDFREGRNEWAFDLRQPEAQAIFRDGFFTHYRVTIRVGTDDINSRNTLTATLLSDSGELGSCDLTRGRGASSHSEFTTECTLDSRISISNITGLKLWHTARNNPFGTDNVDIDEVRLEVQSGPVSTADGDDRDWLTVVQRTGGHESEVVRLKAPTTTPTPYENEFSSNFWVTRLLPRAEDIVNEDLGERITGLRIHTFTNEDDLDGSGPAVFTAALSGHRMQSSRNGPMRVEFGSTGIENGDFNEAILGFAPSYGEGIINDINDRGPDLTFGDLTLTTGEEDSADTMFSFLMKMQDLARGTPLGAIKIEEIAALTGTIALGLAVGGSSWALMDPVSALISGLLVYLGVESYDNWSTLTAVHVVVEDNSERRSIRPLLIGYNPVQRLKRDNSVSTLFRQLPERIVTNRAYGGIVASYTLSEEMGDIKGEDLLLDIIFEDGVILTKAAAPNYQLEAGSEHRLILPFDRLRRGSELKTFRLRLASGVDSKILIRSLDIGLVKDPMQTFAEEYRQVAGLGDYFGQIAIGTDLSGFEALTPFSAIRPGPLRVSGAHDCPTTWYDPSCFGDPIPESGREPGSSLSLDIEDIVGRPDPARANPATGVPSYLSIARVDGPGTRLLDFRETGLSTVGQLPEFAAIAAHADALMMTGAADLGPSLFSSADRLVRAWEKLDTAHDSVTSEDYAAASCTP